MATREGLHGLLDAGGVALDLRSVVASGDDLLRRRSGWGGSAHLERLPDLRPDLVLQGVFLPDGDGLTVVRRRMDRELLISATPRPRAR